MIGTKKKPRGIRRALHLLTFLFVSAAVLLLGQGLYRIDHPGPPPFLPYIDLVSRSEASKWSSTIATLQLASAIGGFGKLAPVPETHAHLPSWILVGGSVLCLALELCLIVYTGGDPHTQKRARLAKLRNTVGRRDWLRSVDLAGRIQNEFAELLDPEERFDIKLCLGESLVGLKELQRALDEYRMALELAPNHSKARIGLVQALMTTEAKIPPEWQSLFVHHLRIEPVNPDIVRFFVDDLVREVKIDKRALSRVDSIFLDLDSRQDVLDTMQDALKARIDSGTDPLRTRLVLSRFYLGRRDLGAVSSILGRALVDDPAMPLIHELLWDAHQELGDVGQLHSFYAKLMPQLKDTRGIDQALNRLRRAMGRDFQDLPHPPTDGQEATASSRDLAGLRALVTGEGKETNRERTLGSPATEESSSGTSKPVIVRGLGEISHAPSPVPSAPMVHGQDDTPARREPSGPVKVATVKDLLLDGIESSPDREPVTTPKTMEESLLEWVVGESGDKASSRSLPLSMSAPCPSLGIDRDHVEKPPETSWETRLDDAIGDLQSGLFETSLGKLQTLQREGCTDRCRLVTHMAVAFLELGHVGLAKEEINLLSGKTLSDEDLYFLADRCERKGLKSQARDLFLKLYAQNLHFRDARERLKALTSSNVDDELVQQLISYIPSRYRDVSLVGRGGMGVVFKGMDSDLERMVAIKMLAPLFKGNVELEQRFFLEARTLARLKHPGILEIYDFNKTGIPYFAMEFLEGQTLSDLLLSKQKLTLGQVLRIIHDVVGVLEFCHRRAVIHRDIKLDNIFVTSRGETKLIDFGLARTTTSPGITQPGIVLGSPLYMSPEQVRGVWVDHRSDIYSLGICLYHVCTGRVPFKDAREHLTAQVKSPRLINAKLPEAVEKIILRCLAKKPEDRFQNAGQLLKELSPFVRQVQSPKRAD